MNGNFWHARPPPAPARATGPRAALVPRPPAALHGRPPPPGFHAWLAPPPPRWPPPMLRAPVPSPAANRPPLFLQPPMRPPPRPPQPLDPDALWLKAFRQQHLPPTSTSPTVAPNKAHGPPLRAMRERLATMLSKLDQLEASARELVKVQTQIAKTNTIEKRAHELECLRQDEERLQAKCEALRAELDELQTPQPLGMGSEGLANNLAFTKHNQKKKLYRKRRQERLRAERTICQGLQGEPDSTGTGPDDVAQPAKAPHRETTQPREGMMQKAELTEALEDCDQSPATRTREQRRRKRRRLLRRATHKNSSPRVPPRDSLRLPLRDPYPVDMETLVAVRCAWDLFLCPPRVNGASSIPSHFVSPPVEPSPAWATYSAPVK